MDLTFRPTLRTDYEGAIRHHPDLLVQLRPEGEPLRCCGDSWCSGTCGLPALVLNRDTTEGAREYKAYSSMTACGPVMQLWRLKWEGPKVEIPAEFHEDFMKRMWF